MTRKIGVGNLTMAGGTINGGISIINGSVTVSGPAPAIISVSQLNLDGVGRIDAGPTGQYNVGPGTSL